MRSYHDRWGQLQRWYRSGPRDRCPSPMWNAGWGRWAARTFWLFRASSSSPRGCHRLVSTRRHGGPSALVSWLSSLSASWAARACATSSSIRLRAVTARLTAKQPAKLGYLTAMQGVAGLALVLLPLRLGCSGSSRWPCPAPRGFGDLCAAWWWSKSMVLRSCVCCGAHLAEDQ